MSYAISKTWTFCASHQLDHLPMGHQCHRLHGHNYAVTVSLHADQLTPEGWVADFGTLSDSLGAWIRDVLDHRHLNEILDKPTAERLAEMLYDQCLHYPWGELVDAVIVNETDTSTAAYIPETQDADIDRVVAAMASYSE